MNALSSVPDLDELLDRFENIKALVFDMDGTLLNSEVLHAKALLALLEESNVKDVNARSLLESFKGVAEPDVLQALIDKNIIAIDTDLKQFIDQKNLYFENFLRESNLKDLILSPRIIELIKTAKIKKLKVAIVTASEASTTALFMNLLGIKDFFDFIITRDDTAKTKPDPMPYEYSFEKLEIQAHEALIFEDSQTGLASAIASGGQVQKVCWYDEADL